MAHILIVDDDELVASLAADTLINAGHACGWVNGAEEAMKLLDWRRPDILLLDQDMPGMSGGELLRILRGSEKHYDLPVLMFTALSGEDDEKQAIYGGANGYIRKPFEPKFLVLRVNQLLRKRETRPKHQDLRDFLAQSAGMLSDPAEIAKRVI